MSTIETPTLADLRELRDFVHANQPHRSHYPTTKSFSAAMQGWKAHLDTIDALIAAHPEEREDRTRTNASAI